MSRRPSPFFPRRIISPSLALGLLLLLTGLAPLSLATAATGGISGDAANSSWYPDQTQLTPSSVATNFGELYRTQLEGQIFAQPLDYQGVVLVATEADKVYGISAATGIPLWSDALYNLNGSNLGTVSSPYRGCGDIGGQVGVTSTPVIDPATGILYVVAAITVQNVPQFRVFALNASDGSVANGWTSSGLQIQGNARNQNPSFPTAFNAAHETQRTGLVLVNGVVYAGFSAQCDYQPYQGWVVGVSTSTQSLTSLWSSAVADGNGSALNGGGIWQSGGAPVVDSHGNLYYATGNAFGMNYPNPESGIGNPLSTYSEAVVKLTTTSGQLAATDWFTPTNALNLDRADLDFASGGPVALPASMSSSQFPNVMLQLGKYGVLDVLNMNNLGGYGSGVGGTDALVSSVPATSGAWSHPAIWPGDGGYVYATVTGTPQQQFPSNPGTLDVFKESFDSSGAPQFTLVGTTAAAPTGHMNFGSSSPLVTSDGTTAGSALVWVVQLPNGPGGSATLDAYAAVPTNAGPSGSLQLVWQSPYTFNGEKLSQPGVGDNMLFLGTRDGELIGYGLNTVPEVSSQGVNFGGVQAGKSAQRFATITATSSTVVNSFAISGSAFTLAQTVPSTPRTLLTGQNLAVPIRFSPTAHQTNLGQLTINTSHGSFTVALFGVQVSSSHFALSSPVIDFGFHPIASGDVSLRVSVRNLTTSSVKVLGLDTSALSSVYTVSHLPTSKFVWAKHWYSFTVTFHPPGTSGNFSRDYPSLLTLKTSIGNAGIPLFATAAPSSNLALTATSLHFGRVKVGHSATLRFRLVNNGGLPLRITQLQSPTTPFTLNQSISVGTIFSPNANVTISVAFHPSHLGAFSSQLVIRGNDDTGIHRLNLSGVAN